MMDRNRNWLVLWVYHALSVPSTYCQPECITVNLRCLSNNWTSGLSGSLGWLLYRCRLHQALEKIPLGENHCSCQTSSHHPMLNPKTSSHHPITAAVKVIKVKKRTPYCLPFYYTGLVHVIKGRQHHMSMLYNIADARCARGVLLELQLSGHLVAHHDPLSWICFLEHVQT